MPEADQREEDAAQGVLGPDFASAQALMNMEVKHVLKELVEDRKKEKEGWQPTKVMQEAIDYVNHLQSANSPTVINSMRECALLTFIATEENLQELLDELIKMQNLPGV